MIGIVEYFNQMIYPRHPELGFFQSDGGNKVVCPFHDDVNASLGIIKDTQVWHCFGCGLAGDVIEMHRRFLEKETSSRWDRWKAEDDLREAFNLPPRVFELKAAKIVPSSVMTVREFEDRLKRVGSPSEWTELLIECIQRSKRA